MTIGSQKINCNTVTTVTLESQSMQENEIVLYQPNETTRIEVEQEDSTVMAHYASVFSEYQCQFQKIVVSSRGESEL